MKHLFLLFFCVSFSFQIGFGQQKPTLNYYLPAISYNPNIPTPASWLGYEVGEWHVTHDQLVGYMRALDAASDRMILQEYGRSHENRPLICLTVSDASNLANLDQIKADRQKLIDPELKDKRSAQTMQAMPAVNYMGYSIHGNETSGSNAAMLVAYYLAAAQGPEIETLLKQTVILFDPCFNPDGMQRFSGWINSHKSINSSTDPAGDEYNEAWPRGRTNHYGFDLNRDWLVARQPESVGRVALFQAWKPNVLTDHHEMGSNSTFFFQPGVPSRVNPITPDKNQALTAKIATYHAQLLSGKNILFYTGENFDDFYYGKGSTYPDAQGAIGILFEQASSRGTAQETENGVLTFPYSIRNQVLASLSTLKAVGDMRVELNEYLREFYSSGYAEAQKSAVKGYLFRDGDIPAREFLNLLGQHSVRVQSLKNSLTVGGQKFEASNAFFVPCEQAQYRLVRAIFERNTSFKDSIFYDISAWTLPDAFGLDWAALPSGQFRAADYEEGVAIVSLNPPSTMGGQAHYAYAIRPEGYEVPKILAKLLKDGIRVRVAMESFEVEGQQYPQGTLLVASDRQSVADQVLLNAMEVLAVSGVPIGVIDNGLSSGGPDLGSSKFAVVRAPKILMLTGDGVNIADAGEIWHLLDTRYNMQLTLADANRFGSLNLDRYNVLILAEGNYGGISTEKVRQFAQDGGTIIATGKSMNWLKSTGLAPIEFRKTSDDKPSARPYGSLEEDKGALAMPGAIFETTLDLTHPLCFGYRKTKLPIFLGDTLFVAPAKNPYATPVVMTDKPLLAGYVHPKELPLASKAAGAIVYGIGRGKLICFPGDPNFRAFWYGTNRLFANAILFGNLISTDSTERK